MASSSEYIRYLVEQLQLIGPVQARRMFGAHGLFLDGLMFAIVAEDCLYFKIDALSRRDYEARGLPPFTYPRGQKLINLSYYQAPEEALDDPAELCALGNRAFAAALYGRQGR